MSAKLINNCLNKGVFNEYALAWKAGRLVWSDNKPDFKDFYDGSNYVNGYGGKIDKSSFDDYCASIKDFDCSGELRNIYKTVLGLSPYNVGPVYNITALFFLSRGKFPIYDRFAHKAVRALALDMKPSEVYIGSNPSKDEIDQVMCMYNEYMFLLKKVFPKGVSDEGTTSPFISRELDQALWVYGHADKKWSLVENKVVNE